MWLFFQHVKAPPCNRFDGRVHSSHAEYVRDEVVPTATCVCVEKKGKGQGCVGELIGVLEISMSVRLIAWNACLETIDNLLFPERSIPTIFVFIANCPGEKDVKAVFVTFTRVKLIN